MHQVESQAVIEKHGVAPAGEHHASPGRCHALPTPLGQPLFGQAEKSARFLQRLGLVVTDARCFMPPMNC